jgi:hypothetical protein
MDQDFFRYRLVEASPETLRTLSILTDFKRERSRTSSEAMDMISRSRATEGLREAAKKLGGGACNDYSPAFIEIFNQRMPYVIDAILELNILNKSTRSDWSFFLPDRLAVGPRSMVFPSYSGIEQSFFEWVRGRRMFFMCGGVFKIL